jgi:ferredoxin
MNSEERRCAVQKAIEYLADFLAGPMCGKCLPCSLGSYEAGVRLKRIAEGQGVANDVAALERIAAQMFEGSMCKKGKDTATFLKESLKSHSKIYLEHVAGRCSEKECLDLVVYCIMPDKCELCGLCQEACRYSAIVGQKQVLFFTGFVPFQIRLEKCVKCGECLEACPYGAVEVASGKEEKVEILVE